MKYSSAVAVALVVLVATPAVAQNRREMQMMADIRMLQEQTQQLQQQMHSALTTLTEALKAINTRIDEQSNSTRRAFADQKLVVDELGNSLRVIRERVDDSNVRIGSLSQEIEALRMSIPQFSAAPATPGGEPAQPPVDATGQPAAFPPVQTAPSAVGPGVSPQRMYDTAWSDYTSGQWELCIGGFEQYLRTFPRSELAADAQFYIGECYFLSGRFTEAVDAYNRTITGYAKSAQVASALYKRGLAFERLQQLDRARESYEQVVKDHADSAAARLAKQNLDRLSRGKPPA
jgi:tol-pal system protein YbgF